MNLLVEKGVLREMECGSNFAYILNDNSLFLSTEYKVLQSQVNSSFVRCMKMQYNGKTELYYLVENNKPLSAMLSRLEPDQFMIVVSSLLAGIIDVKSNGFLSCNNIDSTFEHIYVDQATFKVSLVYLPLSQHEYHDDALFENALRENLVRVISGISQLTSVKTTQLCADLQNGMFSIEEIYSRMGRTGIEEPVIKRDILSDIKPDILPEIEPVKPKPSGFLKVPDSLMPGPQVTASMRLIALDAPTRLQINITKAEFYIGRRETNDGVVSYNSMIGRTHCKVIRNGEQYLIVDLQSVNGTYVNGVRLQSGSPASVKNGDIVRLANSDFQVVIG